MYSMKMTSEHSLVTNGQKTMSSEGNGHKVIVCFSVPLT